MRRPSDDDWMSEWREVQDHRYDPGHWLGRVHPFYRRLGEGPVSSTSGVVLVVLGLAIMLSPLLKRLSWPPLPALVLGALFVTVGVSRFRAARRQRRDG